MSIWETWVLRGWLIRLYCEWLDAFWTGSALRRAVVIGVFSFCCRMEKSAALITFVAWEEFVPFRGCINSSSKLCHLCLSAFHSVCCLQTPPSSSPFFFPLLGWEFSYQHKLTRFPLSGSLMCLSQHHGVCWSQVRLPLIYCWRLCPFNPILH